MIGSHEGQDVAERNGDAVQSHAHLLDCDIDQTLLPHLRGGNRSLCGGGEMAECVEV